MEAKATTETLSEWPAVGRSIFSKHEFDRNTIWMEIGVVLSFTAVTNLWSAIAFLAWPEQFKGRTIVYEYSTMLVRNVLVILLLLYLLRRSGEPWNFWGIVPLQWRRDLGRALLVLFAGNFVTNVCLTVVDSFWAQQIWNVVLTEAHRMAQAPIRFPTLSLGWHTPLVTHIFLHGDIWHLLFNMLAL